MQSALTSKDFEKKTTHTIINLAIKEVSFDLGYLNEDNKIKGLSIFSKEFNVSFKSKQANELTMTVQGSIGDFGIELFTKDPIS